VTAPTEKDSPVLDAVVIGGGPAGAAVGRLLAAWGHSVRILTKPVHPARGLAESLPPSTRKLLAAVGVLDAVERAGFYRTTGNTVWWGSEEARIEHFAPGGLEAGEPSGGAVGGNWGYQVHRPDFDRVLLDEAVRAGAQVCAGATVRRVREGREGQGSGAAGAAEAAGTAEAAEAAGAARSAGAGERPAAVAVDYELDGEPASVSGRFVLDCSGRAGVIARQGFRRYAPGHRMQALIGIWQRDAGWALPDETQTIVETYEDGWAWSVPVSTSVRHVAAMVDGATTRLTRGPIADAYRAELAKTRQLHRQMGGATLQHVWACDASLYDAHAYAGPHWLLVGDAGSFIDPLSSFGVKKALASAWLAAVTTHTCLQHPERRQAALDFFSHWEQQVYATHLRRTRDFARGAHAQHPHPFWAARAETAIDAAIDGSDEELLRDPRVQETFRLLQRREVLDLVRADAIRLEMRPLIRDREIVLEDAVPLTAARTCRRYVAGVDLVALAAMASAHGQVPDLYETYCRLQAPVSLPHLLGGLSLLIANGVLTFHAR
jgi:flavin-dependent dehydrogenase